MKKLSFLFIGIAVLIMAGPAVAADDFTSVQNGILEITNLDDSDLAIFAGKIERDVFLGGIKAQSSRKFDLSKLPGIPSQGAVFFTVTRYETFKTKGNAGITADDVLYTGLIVYNLDEPNQITRTTIPNSIGGDAVIYVTNSSRYYLELHKDEPDGEVLSVLVPGERSKKLWIELRQDYLPYTIFPRYLYIDTKTGELARTEPQDRKRVVPIIPGSGEMIYVLDFFGPPRGQVENLDAGIIRPYLET